MNNRQSEHNDLSTDDMMLLGEYRYVRTKQQLEAPDSHKAWQEFRKKYISKDQTPGVQQTPSEQSAQPAASAKPHPVTLRLSLKVAAAVAALLIVGAGALYLTLRPKAADQLAQAERQLIAPAVSPQDTLTTIFEANRGPQKILMGPSKSQLTPISGKVKTREVCADTAKAVFHAVPMTALRTIACRTIITPRGKTYDVTLSDGSQIKLNADSKLIFPVTFTGRERRVVLEGEAYFKVAKDKDHPFIVETRQVQTTVLGTEFNVKAYTDGTPVVTLFEGEVKVAVKGEQDALILQPGQEAALRDKYLLAAAKHAGAASWTEDLFDFHALPLGEAMKEMGRWYNVDVELTEGSLAEAPITLRIPRKVSLKDFANSINLTPNLSAWLTPTGIIISPKDESRKIDQFSLYKAQPR